MNDQDQNPTTPPPPNAAAPQPVYRDWREQRRAEHMARHEAHWQARTGWHSGWIAGVILILLGVAFLFEDLGLRFLTNWWALFILIPAFWSFVSAWEIQQRNNRLTRAAAGSLTMGIIFTLICFVFLFNVAADIFWPVLLIAGGLALLGTYCLPE